MMLAWVIDPKKVKFGWYYEGILNCRLNVGAQQNVKT